MEEMRCIDIVFALAAMPFRWLLNRKNLNYTSILSPSFIPLPDSTSVYKQILHCCNAPYRDDTLQM